MCLIVVRSVLGASSEGEKLHGQESAAHNLADRRSLYVPRTLIVGQGKTNARDVHVSAICGVQGNKQLPPGVQTMNYQDYLGAREGNGCTKSERCATLSQPRPSLRTTLLNRHQFPVLNLEIHSFADQDMLLLFVAQKSQFSSLQLDRNYVDRVKHDTARNRGCCEDYDPTYLTYHVFLSSFPAP
ncbi:predicted protein [Botrytis cinerea T4]|uniref:Uncharacterized protein n=1 Tax=Botryotinia fuckeliana (strain T4) TaxID=999810 RepID=G2YKG7_BOTF4|nr:predicted protein [Botrytis cinerea T4]